MKIAKAQGLIGCLICFIVLFSCKKDDEGAYANLEIITEADLVQVLQDQSTEIAVFSNDLNIPVLGNLSVSSATNGEVIVLNNGTTSDPSDDRVGYTPNANFTGEDQFTYTICSQGGDCVTEDVEITVISASQVVFNLAEMPYPNLSDYNFFDGDIADQIPNFGVVPYKPISTLFTDYAKKKRFIWMPNNVAANYAGDHDILNFPVGTIMIKAFYYNNVLPQQTRKNLETRLIIRKEEGWVFANYIWNEDQTDAVFNLNGSNVDLEWVQENETRSVRYRIPGASECFTCHETAEDPIPIGLKPQNLNGEYPYQTGSENMLQKLIQMGYLEEDVPGNISTVVDWEDTSQPLDLRVRSYTDINCAHCHSEQRYCHYRPIRFQFSLNDDPVNLGVCVEPDNPIDHYTKIVEPQNIENSLLYFRLNSTAQDVRMPLLGRTLIHEEAILLVEEWINSLPNTNCQ